MDALVVFWDPTPLFLETIQEDTVSTQAISRHTPIVCHVVKGRKKKGGGGLLHALVRANNNKPMHAPQTQDNSYSKSKSVKRLEETGTRPCSIRGTSLMKS